MEPFYIPPEDKKQRIKKSTYVKLQAFQSRKYILPLELTRASEHHPHLQPNSAPGQNAQATEHLCIIGADQSIIQPVLKPNSKSTPRTRHPTTLQWRSFERPWAERTNERGLQPTRPPTNQSIETETSRTSSSKLPAIEWKISSPI